jgi:hypothetical protein
MKTALIKTDSRAKVYDLYSQGLKPFQIFKQLDGLAYNYIDNLVYEWEIRKANEKNKIVIEQSALLPPNRIINSTSETDFVLISNSPKVWNAYRKMINPKNKKQDG